MKNDLTCEVVQDLLPSYVDGLTSSTTTEAVAKHLNECSECTRIYSDMKQPSEPNLREDEPTIDFLKKNRAKNRKHVIYGMTLIAFLCLITVLLHTYFSEVPVTSNDMIDYTIAFERDDAKYLCLYGSLTDRSLGAAGIEYKEDNDTLKIRLTATHASFFHRNGFSYRYKLSDQIRYVYLNDQLILEDDIYIQPETAAVYAAIHPYVGSMSDNGETLTALNINYVFPTTTQELQTSVEPYGWTIHLSDVSYAKATERLLHDKMKNYATAILVSTENLGSLTYAYYMEGQPAQYTYTKEEAEKDLGHPLDYYRHSAVKLQNLLTELGIVNGQVPYESLP